MLNNNYKYDTNELTSLIENYEIKGDFSGAILIRDSNENIHEFACGYANRSFKVKNRINTRFATASATKVFTAVAVLQLVDDGLIALNSRIHDIIDLKNTRIPLDVTVEHLINHMSGIPDYFDEYDENNIENIFKEVPNYSLKTHNDFIPLFKDKVSNFKVGTLFEYSNSNYILLGIIIEKITGMKYCEYIKENIFNKFNMTSSDFIPLDIVHEEVAEAYIPIENKEGKLRGWRRNIYLIPPYGNSDGGAYTTVNDFLIFIKALREYKVLSKELTDTMLKQKFPMDKSDLWEFRFGMWFNADRGKIISYGVSGGDPGVSVLTRYYPEIDFDIIVLGNQDGCAGEIIHKISELIISR